MQREQNEFADGHAAQRRVRQLMAVEVGLAPQADGAHQFLVGLVPLLDQIGVQVGHALRHAVAGWNDLLIILGADAGRQPCAVLPGEFAVGHRGALRPAEHAQDAILRQAESLRHRLDAQEQVLEVIRPRPAIGRGLEELRFGIRTELAPQVMLERL